MIRVLLFGAAMTMFVVGAVKSEEVKPAEGKNSLCGAWTDIQIKIGGATQQSVRSVYAMPNGDMIALMQNNKQEWSMWWLYADGSACFVMEGAGLHLVGEEA